MPAFNKETDSGLFLLALLATVSLGEFLFVIGIGALLWPHLVQRRQKRKGNASSSSRS